MKLEEILAWMVAVCIVLIIVFSVGCAPAPHPFKLGDEIPAPRGCDKSAIERGVNC